jgi:hypothetical protein
MKNHWAKAWEGHRHCPRRTASEPGNQPLACNSMSRWAIEERLVTVSFVRGCTRLSRQAICHLFGKAFAWSVMLPRTILRRPRANCRQRLQRKPRRSIVLGFRSQHSSVTPILETFSSHGSCRCQRGPILSQVRVCSSPSLRNNALLRLAVNFFANCLLRPARA